MSLLFEDWSESRRIRSLELMDEYLRTHATRTIYDTQWVRYGAHPFQKDKLREIAQDNEKYTNALFGFYVCLTTDLSWVKF